MKEIVSSSVTEKRNLADTLKTSTEHGDGATVGNAIETEEERLERLRAEKKALQDKLGTKKGSKKDTKKPVDETTDAQQVNIKTEPDPATDATPAAADNTEARSGTSGADLSATQSQAQPQPSPPKPAAAAPDRVRRTPARRRSSPGRPAAQRAPDAAQSYFSSRKAA